MSLTIRSALIASAALAMLGTATAMPLDPQLPAQIATPLTQSVSDLLCGRGWHYNYFFLRCDRNPHICPAGQFWVSMLRVCL